MSIFDRKAPPTASEHEHDTGVASVAYPEQRTEVAQVAEHPAAPSTPTDALKTSVEGAIDRAHQVVDVGRDAMKDVAATAKHDGQQVAAELGTQAHRVASEARTRLRAQAADQQSQWAQRLSAISDELLAMAAERPDTPARAFVGQLAEKSSAFAEYLGQRRPEDVLDELQEFARRRPGTFIATAAAAGFVVGRLGKGAWAAQMDGATS